jgi:hypothetical protein
MAAWILEINYEYLMSLSLERLIAKQQAKIDALEAQADSASMGWIRQQKKMDSFCVSVFNLLSCPTNENFQLDVKRQLVVSFNYCLDCEMAPCECDD